mgnify:CR=1 FL=1
MHDASSLALNLQPGVSESHPAARRWPSPCENACARTGASQSTVPASGSAQDFLACLPRDIERTRKAIQAGGIQPEQPGSCGETIGAKCKVDFTFWTFQSWPGRFHTE